MICLNGDLVCGGTGSGAAYVFKRNAEQFAERKEVSAAEEARRLELAISAVKEKIALCAAQAESETVKEIFEVHGMMLEDEDVLESLRLVTENPGETAEEAVLRTGRYFSELFSSTGDDYLIARTDDIREVCDSLLDFLAPKENAAFPEEPFVLVADELFPGDIAKLYGTLLSGIVIGSGSVYSHASILIREMGIPALICEKLDVGEIKENVPVLIDADGGKVCFDPDHGAYEAFMRAKSHASGKKIFSLDSLPCDLYVNIGNPSEVNNELMEKCGGIGLFRTEYLYFGRKTPPDEAEQVSVYREVLEKAGGKRVIFRTFDIGSDKTAESMPIEAEENPALGFRGLRVYSLYPEAFMTQLRALLRAAVYGKARIMYPMVTSAEEIRELGKLLLKAASELEERNIPYEIPPQGAMIETPAAALLSDEIAKEVDFFSVGTNDLSQYTSAIDRQSGKLGRFRDPDHKAVLSLVKIAAENARKNGIGIGICGELAADALLLEKWLEIGVDYLSVSPSAIDFNGK